MRLPHFPSGNRFFAQVLGAVFECPKCGAVLAFHNRTTTGSMKRSGAGNAQWNPTTSQIRCPYCNLTGVAGLLLWPCKLGGGVRTLARDQVPTPRQNAQLRALGGGLWLPPERALKAKRPEDTNITARCSCREGTENTTEGDPKCPIHGEGIVWVPRPFVPFEEE